MGDVITFIPTPRGRRNARRTPRRPATTPAERRDAVIRQAAELMASLNDDDDTPPPAPLFSPAAEADACASLVRRTCRMAAAPGGGPVDQAAREVAALRLLGSVTPDDGVLAEIGDNAIGAMLRLAHTPSATTADAASKLAAVVRDSADYALAGGGTGDVAWFVLVALAFADLATLAARAELRREEAGRWPAAAEAMRLAEFAAPHGRHRGAAEETPGAVRLHRRRARRPGAAALGADRAAARRRRADLRRYAPVTRRGPTASDPPGELRRVLVLFYELVDHRAAPVSRSARRRRRTAAVVRELTEATTAFAGSLQRPGNGR